MTTDKRAPSPNCHGCGALLRRRECAYCGRKAAREQWAVIEPDPRDDPRRTVELRKVMTCN